MGAATEDEGESAEEHPIDADESGDDEDMDGAAANDAVVDEEPAAHPMEPVAKVSTS